MLEKLIRYVVKETSVATENNRNFAGEIGITYHGKGTKLLACAGSHYENDPFMKWYCQPIQRHALMEYGYLTEGQAKKSYCYKKPENSEYWKSSAEIVRIEIAEGEYDGKEIV